MQKYGSFLKFENIIFILFKFLKFVISNYEKNSHSYIYFLLQILVFIQCMTPTLNLQKLQLTTEK